MTRVRFAPSPTGFLHIGGARTFLFNWLYARKLGGTVVLRIDDTDTLRSTDASLQSILQGMEWLELDWDEQYYQSKRLQLHIDAAHALLKKGAAYRDFVPASTDDPKDHSETKVSWTCNPGERERSVEESDRLAAEGKPFVIRFRVPREDPKGVAFKDMVFGKQFRKYVDMEDFALLRSDGNPTYHLATCVDDGDLKITDILRGQDHLTNTFKHVLIFEALGYETPTFGHMPLLLGPDGSKLSKRKHGPIVSVTNYRDAGFLPQAFINFISLLGWSSKDNQEVFSLEELRAKFNAADILRTNSIVQFDENDAVNWAPPKAVWLNGQHLRSMPVEKLIKYVNPELIKAGWWQDEFEGDPDILKKIDAIRSRFNMLGEFQQRGAAYFCDEFPTEDKAVENLDKDNARELLRGLADPLEALADFSHDTVEATLRAYAEEKGVKAGLLINGSRAALTGQSVGPSAFEVFDLIGQEKAVQRLRAV
ncbi:MAG: glutamate--tRNA ligase [Acidobacteria bacterium]|nr:glutamate--tRNA ligase [Acidobacteriota bacterium]MDA1235501.1 glutamate--tRNA ligase [Acidobacteriota bacterium]